MAFDTLHNLKEKLQKEASDVVVDFIPGIGGGYYWLGLTDATEETKWVWTSDGTTPSYTGWAQGEPNSYQGMNEDCAAFDFLAGYAWADIPCQSPIFYICEK
ncbi:COL12-like protein, partial [Mya arenaria]